MRKKKTIRSGNFSPFLFHFLHTVNFIGRNVQALVIKRFDQFTLACSSHVFNYQDNTSKNLYRRTSVSREYVSSEFDCWRISVIVHRSANDKLAVDSLVLLVCGLSLILPGNFFQSTICEHVSGKLSKCLFIRSYTHLIT